MNLTDPDGRKIDWGDNGRDCAREAYCRGVEAADRVRGDNVSDRDHARDSDIAASLHAYKSMKSHGCPVQV